MVDLQYNYNKVYLFKNGINTGLLNWENHPTTGNYSNIVEPVQREGYILFNIANKYTVSGYVSIEKIDLTPYNKICFDGYRTQTASSTGGYLILAKNKEAYAYSEGRISIDNTTRDVRELDITQLNDQYYISPLLIQAGNTLNFSLYMYNLWLEK